MKPIRLAVIADDITGASDCGGQLIHYGLNVSVILNNNSTIEGSREAIIYNTDSRSVSQEEAYTKVKYICEKIKGEKYDIVYKKIDSTMRGNIGQEINAVYDVFKPDFVLIAPAYPENGRQVIDGVHFLNNKQLHETEVANDPKTPVTDSNITRLIQKQSNKDIGHISCGDLHEGFEKVATLLEEFKKNNICYITVDSIQGSDLESLAEFIYKARYSTIWVGSAGLMNYLPKVYGLNQKGMDLSIKPAEKPVLLVVGSVSAIGRVQLEHLLNVKDVIGLEMNSSEVLIDNEVKEKEINRLKEEAKKAFSENKNIALFSSNNVKEIQAIGAKIGKTPIELSNIIADTLGELAVELINSLDINHLFLTGGDTAYQVLDKLDVKELRLIDEVESGIPIGYTKTNKEIYAITKAGNFGSKLAMVNALNKLKGGKL